VIATHSPILLTFPDAEIISFDETPLQSVRLEETGILDDPQRYWRELLKDDAD